MGVYYIIVNDTKKEYMDPDDFDENFKLSGIFQGIHGSAIAKMLCFTNKPSPYSYGYWAGDSIRVLGDGTTFNEHEMVVSNYKNISFYALALEFENDSTIRDEILKRASQHDEILQGLIEVNSQIKLTNLNHTLLKRIDSGI